MSIKRGTNGIVIRPGGGIVRGLSGGTGAVINELNVVTFKNVSGGDITDYPMQLGRSFREGEITDYPQVFLDDIPVLTQSHVEQRLDDGTVDHAVMFFYIPYCASNQTINIQFGNQTSSHTTGGLTAAEVLADWDFDATVDMVKTGVTKSSSARTMLAAGHYWTMYSGPVATQFIIEDHSEFPAYDFGWDAYTPVRPIYHATFWPDTNQTRVRYITELAKTTELATVAVDSIVCKLGQSAPSTVYTKTTTSQNKGGRWTVPIATAGYWKGGTPTELYNLNHNLRYLGLTRQIARWDPDIEMTDARITTHWNTWNASSHDITGNGMIAKIMDGGGGRDDIGLISGWQIWDLYYGDYRTRQMSRGNADLFGSFPIHFREAEYGRTRGFDRTIVDLDAGGKPLSINTRPTTFLWNGFTGGGVTAVADRMTNVDGSTSFTVNGWQPDNSHHADPYSYNYLVTGDYWYLEQMWFSAHFLIAFPSPANVSYGDRGPAGYYGGNSTDLETRDIAWNDRQRFHAWGMTPDRFSDEKTYLYNMSIDCICTFEGIRGLDTERSTHPVYQWSLQWKDIRWPNGVIPPLGHASTGVTQSGSLGGIDWNVTHRGTAVWMHDYLVVVFGRALELGLPLGPSLEFISILGNTRWNDGGISPFSHCAYYEPTVKDAGLDNFNTWAEVLTGFTAAASDDFEGDWNAEILGGPAGHNRAAIATAAAAFSYDYPGGEGQWDWMVTYGRTPTQILTHRNWPNWMFIPRALPE